MEEEVRSQKIEYRIQEANEKQNSGISEQQESEDRGQETEEKQNL
jgi:hypothetical protein